MPSVFIDGIEIELAAGQRFEGARLVLREGGEAQSDTQWRIETPQGQVVKETVGALPSHFLAPGQYRAKAVTQGKTYAGDFTVSENQAAIVEVLMQ